MCVCVIAVYDMFIDFYVGLITYFELHMITALIFEWLITGFIRCYKVTAPKESPNTMYIKERVSTGNIVVSGVI